MVHCLGAQAEKAVAGRTLVKRNRFVQLSDGTREVNWALEERPGHFADVKGYVTNLAVCPDGTPDASPSTSSDHRIRHARGHGVLRVPHRLIHNALRSRRYRTIQIHAGQHILTLEDPLTPDLSKYPRAHQMTKFYRRGTSPYVARRLPALAPRLIPGFG